MRYILYIMGCMLAWGCSNSESTDTTKSDTASIQIERLDKQLFTFENPDELQEFLFENPTYTRSFYRAFAEDTAFVNHLFYILSHPDSKKFYEEVQQSYGDLTNLEMQFGAAFARIKAQFPDFIPPKVVATFTGLENDIYVSDSVVFIALEAFAGPQASYRPQQPNYILQRYDKEFIVPTVVRFIADKYNRSNEADDSLLDDMLYFGKAFAFTAEILPDVKHSTIIAYPDSTVEQVVDAEGIIWAHFLDNELLYEKNRRIKERYLGERPSVAEIGPACPGRIAQWLGWRIIQAYQIEKTEVSLADLMAKTDVQEILRNSKYRGGIE